MPLKPAQKPTTRTASGSHELECGRHAHGGEARSHDGKNPCESRLKAIAKFGFAMLLEIAVQDGAFEVSWDGPEAHLIGLGAFRTARLRGGEHGLLDLGASGLRNTTDKLNGAKKIFVVEPPRSMLKVISLVDCKIPKL